MPGADVRVLAGRLQLRAGQAPSAVDLLGQLPGPELPDGQEFQHAVLHVLQAVVVLVEHFVGVVQVEVVVGAAVPGQFGDPLQVGADDLGLHRLAPGAFQPAQLALDLDAGLVGQVQLVELRAELVDLAALLVLAQFLLDRLELLAEVHLALALAQLLLHVRLDLGLRLEHADLALDVDQDPPHPLLDAERLQQRCFSAAGSST